MDMIYMIDRMKTEKLFKEIMSIMSIPVLSAFHPR